MLVREVKELARGPVKKQVEARIKEFDKKRGWKELFSELCFCILTANYTAEGGIRIQDKLGFKGFYELDEDKLAHRLVAQSHRFPNARAAYIVEARRVAKNLPRIYDFKGKNARIWLQGVKGIGMKEGSHFLRNVGFKDVAILDRHILRLLADHGYILKVPKSMSRQKYVEIEKEMEKLSERTGLDLARLDLYLWYMQTGKVLK